MTKKLICFGDSITARTETRETPVLTTLLAEKLNDITVLNAGVSGDTTSDALARIQSDVLKYDYDFVTVLFGANDAAFHRLMTAHVFKYNLQTITRQIGPSKTILMTPAPVDESLQFARTNHVLGDYAEKVREVSRDSGSHLIDLFTEMINRDDYKVLLKGQKNDGLHIGEAGYVFLSDLIVHKIESLT